MSPFSEQDVESLRRFWNQEGHAFAVNELLAVALASLARGNVATQSTPSLVDFLTRNRPGSILDVGCNAGLNLFAVHKLTPGLLFGVDASHAALGFGQVARGRLAHPRIHFLQGTATHLPVKDAGVDAVITSGLLCIFAPDRVQECLRELIRVSGRFLFHFEIWNPDQPIQKQGDPPYPVYSHPYAELYPRLIPGCRVEIGEQQGYCRPVTVRKPA